MSKKPVAATAPLPASGGSYVLEGGQLKPATTPSTGVEPTVQAPKKEA